MHIAWPHVFGGVDTETSDSQADQVVQVFGDFVSNIGRFELQIWQTDEFTISDLILLQLIRLMRLSSNWVYNDYYLVDIVIVFDVSAAAFTFGIVEIVWTFNERNERY